MLPFEICQRLQFWLLFGPWSCVFALCAGRGLCGSLPYAGRGLHCSQPCADQVFRLGSAHGWGRCGLCSPRGGRVARTLLRTGGGGLVSGAGGGLELQFSDEFVREFVWAPCIWGVCMTFFLPFFVHMYVFRDGLSSQ